MQPILFAQPGQGLEVSILTGPFGPVQHSSPSMTVIARAFQSSPALSGRCNLGGHAARLRRQRVSILTGPFGPVQPGPPGGLYNLAGVSILTGPFGPVQRSSARSFCRRPASFNPHRPFRAGATKPDGGARRTAGCFNPHRPFRAGATFAPSVRLVAGSSFNPHRPFRAGATVPIINHVLERAGSGEIANLPPSAYFEGAWLAPETRFSRCPREKSRFANLPGF